jgi:hypothetical protein
MSISLTPAEHELVEITFEDLKHIAREATPECDDHQLRRISVQLRNLLIEDNLIRSWKTIQLQPKAPTIVAPLLTIDNLGPSDFAVAGGGNVSGVSIANAQIIRGRALLAEEVKAQYERTRGHIETDFSLSDYKNSCAVYVKGQIVTRRQLVQYVANKKGGAHLDTRRSQDEQAYVALDEAVNSSLFFGWHHQPRSGKNPIYLELLSIGQHLTSAPDIKRFLEAAQSELKK